MASGIFPSNLKNGYVTPILKSGSSADIKNYRPVVIQSTLAKVFEALVLKKLMFNLKSVIDTGQHGFVKGRSTTSNLLCFQDHILTAFSNSHQVDAVYTDFSKAFDRVSHKHLIAKLKAIGVGGSLLLWLESYLQGRFLQVRVAGSLSQPFPAVSGVPQGSLLGPVLFTIFINDLAQYTEGSHVLLFADDAKIFKEIVNVEDCEGLQNSIDLLAEWCRINEMSLNASNCSVITFTRSNSYILHQYKLEDKPLARSSKVKDLGVMLTPDLNPQEHINYICKKANSALYFIFRTSRDNFSVDALVTLYIHLVRPLLEFSSTVWSPYQVGQIAMLEGIQSRFIRFIGLRLGFEYRAVPVQDLQLRFNLRPLHVRRNINDLMFLKKLITSVIDAPELLMKLDLRTSRNLRHTQLFARRQYSTLYMFHSPLPRLQRLANNIPDHLDLFNMSSETFKRKLTNCLQ
jgi:ribonuclease P/MRP protein subunit RPP40